MIAIITLLMVLYLSLMVNRLATIALTHTGMSEESARLQARSALSGCGFTTSESENMVIHPIRRRILLLLMLFGNVGVVATLATVILGFIDNEAVYNRLWVKMTILVPGLWLLWFMAQSKWFADKTVALFHWLVRSSPQFNFGDQIRLYHLDNEHKLAEIFISAHHPCCGRNAEAVTARQVMLLGIRKENGDYLSNPPPETAIPANCCLIVYGVDADITAVSADSVPEADRPPATASLPPQEP